MVFVDVNLPAAFCPSGQNGKHAFGTDDSRTIKDGDGKERVLSAV
jgi:hypothetical protein